MYLQKVKCQFINRKQFICKKKNCKKFQEGEKWNKYKLRTITNINSTSNVETISAGPKILQLVVFGTVEATECDHFGAVANW